MQPHTPFSQMMFLHGYHSFQSNAPFQTKCQFVTAGHVVGKLEYAGLQPQTQLRKVASSVTLADLLPVLRYSPEHPV